MKNSKPIMLVQDVAQHLILLRHLQKQGLLTLVELSDPEKQMRYLERDLQENTLYIITPQPINSQNDAWDIGHALRIIVDSVVNRNITVAIIIQEDNFYALGAKGFHETDKLASFQKRIE